MTQNAKDKDRVDALAEQVRLLIRRVSVAEQEVARLIQVVILMGQAGQTLEQRVNEMEQDRKPDLIVPTSSMLT